MLVHPGAVIGADGFGLAFDKAAFDHGGWVKVPQLGGVRIGDDCEIGANTTIDRGAIEDTVLEEDVRLDNQIQIAHNVHIGAHTAMAGCAAVAGSAKIGRYCLIGGGAGILGHLSVADRVTITARALVTHSIRSAGEYSSGVPLQESRQWRRNAARFKHLDDLARRLQAIEKESGSKRRQVMNQPTKPRRNARGCRTQSRQCCRIVIRSCSWIACWSYSVGKSLRALKNVSINEPFFQGHFPGHPVMPGVLIIEALAQASGLLVQLSKSDSDGPQPLYYLVKVDKAKFTQIVGPGDQLILDVELKRMLRGMGQFACRASVAGKQVAEAELLCAGRAAG